LLFDLLTPDEELDRANVFDIELLADRLIEVTGWLTGYQAWSNQPIGYFGASTGAAAALWAAAELGTGISAVVSRGGRPDLTGPRLAEVRAPTLFIVGGLDTVVLDLNRSAQAELRCESTLEVVPGATHLFEEPGALDQVAELARHWFTTHFLGSGAVKIGGALRDQLSPSPAKEADNVTEATERDPSLERAREEAEGTELLERPERGGSLEREREEAQGVELFADPDATLPATALREGSPGHEVLTGNSVGLGPDDETNREGEEEDRGIV
jgi:hypothetical protein